MRLTQQNTKLNLVFVLINENDVRNIFYYLRCNPGNVKLKSLCIILILELLLRLKRAFYILKFTCKGSKCSICVESCCDCDNVKYPPTHQHICGDTK